MERLEGSSWQGQLQLDSAWESLGYYPRFRARSVQFCVTYPLMVEDIIHFTQVLGLDKPFVAGYSDGGQIAKHMAINFPGLVRGYMIGGIFNSITFLDRRPGCVLPPGTILGNVPDGERGCPTSITADLAFPRRVRGAKSQV
jgi:pimeloyl-ACP methyl ester carboxylesterase